MIAANNGELLLYREEQDPNAKGKKLESYCQYFDNEIERLPISVEDFGELNKIDVNVQNHSQHSYQEGFFCYRCQSNGTKIVEDVLSESQKNLLGRNAEDLLKSSIIPRYWAVQFDAKPGIFIQKRPCDRRKLAASDEYRFQINYKSKKHFVSLLLHMVRLR